MLVEEIAPTEIGKHAEIVKSAQEDLSGMDVLVCGRCLNVFHFIEEFQQHKEDICDLNHSLHKSSDTKPNIWGFVLWKAAQLSSHEELSTTTSWSLYQNWVKLEDGVRETWIVAGKTIQSFGKLGLGDLHEIPVRITKTIINSKTRDSSPTRKALPPPLPIKNAVSNLKEASENEKKLSNTPPPTLKQVNRLARRTLHGTTETVPEKVEKIVAKRFNPRRKLHEYLVKWDAPALDNSWESAANLEDVPHFLEVFEKQLARQKQTRALLNAKGQGLNKANEENKPSQQPTRKLPTLPTTIPSTGTTTAITTAAVGDNNTTQVSSSSPQPRPTRTSKTKAMDQVKQWVNETTNAGSSSPLSANEDESSSTANLAGGNAIGGVKRKLNDSDINNSNPSDSANTGAHIMEDLEEDLIPSHTVKRLKNGSSISVEVKTKTEKVEKIIKVNGTAGGVRTTSITGESLPVAANSADVIITQDSCSSGVLRKPGTNGTNSKLDKGEASIRLLTKAESLVSNTGIVRASGSGGGSGSGEESAVVQSKSSHVTPASRLQQLRSSGGSGVSSTTGGRQTPTSVPQRQQQQVLPTRSAVQRKSVNQAQKPGVRVSNTPIRSTSHALNPAGRLIISRTTSNSTPVSSQRQIGNKSVTPEEKIFNLSKSGDLKVTRKVMTREEIRAAQQQRQQQRQPQSQVQIQKVQQIAPPRTRVSGTSPGVRAAQQQQEVAPIVPEEEEEEEHQAQLCPITGKLIGQEETQLKIEQEQQEQLAQEQEQQQQLQALLSGGDQQMLTNEDGTPLLVRGEDGTVYQVAGKNAEGQTILVTQGPDGEQQFAYVAATEGEETNQVLTLDNAVAEAVAALPAEQQAEALAAAAAGESGQFLVQMTEDELVQHQAAAFQAAQQNSTDPNAPNAVTNQLTIQTAGEQGVDAQDGNIPAEVVQADLPSPGGTRRVVLLLNDGTFMMTEMHDDEFKALNITT